MNISEELLHPFSGWKDKLFRWICCLLPLQESDIFVSWKWRL